jgi:hypothetical protein
MKNFIYGFFVAIILIVLSVFWYINVENRSTNSKFYDLSSSAFRLPKNKVLLFTGDFFPSSPKERVKPFLILVDSADFNIVKIQAVPEQIIASRRVILALSKVTDQVILYSPNLSESVELDIETEQFRINKEKIKYHLEDYKILFDFMRSE